MKTVNDILHNKHQKETWSVLPDSSVFDALMLMSQKDIGALMVIDEKGKVAGIFSERDYARKIILKGKASRETKVKEIMTPANKMYSVPPGMPIDDCMALVTEKHIRHLPVFWNNEFQGLISIGDIVKNVISEKQDTIDHLNDYIAGTYV